MADPTPAGGAPEAPPASPCRHLRSAGMYIYTDGRGHPDGGHGSTNSWCLRTMKSFGPDDEPVGGEECRDPARSCYEPT